MKISELLLEYNENLLVQNFAAKIEAHAKLDTTAPKNLNGTQLIQAIAKENKDFAFWISLNYANYNDKKFNGGIQRWEDITSRAIPDLEEFKTLLRKPNLSPPLPIRDINQIKGLDALFNILKPYREQEQPITDADEQQFVNSNQVKIVINKPNLKVVVPLTKQAAIFYGRGTQWCTSAKKNNEFSEYDEDGPLYMILAGGKKYQWHFETSQYKDSSDNDSNPIELAMKYPGLIEIISPGTTGNFWDRLDMSSRQDFIKDIANDRDTPATILSALSKNKNEYVRWRVARNSNTPPEILNKLSRDKNITIRSEVAENPNTPQKTLSILAKVKHETIRARVAGNISVSPETLIDLSHDNKQLVRGNVAGNPNTPLEVLSDLSKDTSSSVKSYVAYNSNTPPELLTTLSKCQDGMVCMNIALNLNTPFETLFELSKSTNPGVRYNVAVNSNTPPEVLIALSRDYEYSIRIAAQENENYPQ